MEREPGSIIRIEGTELRTECGHSYVTCHTSRCFRKPATTRTWKVEGRNSYYAVDEFVDGRCLRMVVAVESKNTAEIIAGALADAYKHGREDKNGS